ncbi:MAG: M1 family metallopeptidase [Bacteroidetes bacterium]|nr:M1 family metallopeptidase [Bacteroidota bacterium]
MKKYFSFLLVCISFISFGQGRGEGSYFQQEVKYKINVKLDDIKHEFAADESMEYINNSPDELSFIWFHLWPNGYKNNNTPLGKQLIEEGNRNFYFAEAKDRGYIDGLDFKVNDQPVKMEYGTSIDMCKIYLNEPLKPGGKITITTPFHVKIPIGVFSRLGHIGQQYQITQWYPKPAVYDKYGWHPIPYLNQGEFYSEFGSFDVFITIPKNYVVGATGDLVDGEAETEWLSKKAEETNEMTRIPRDTTFQPSSSEIKTLHYHQEKVHDFAWFADKRYYVTKAEVELPYSKRKVTTWAMFTGTEARIWKNSAQYVADAIYYYSKWNGDYPYNHATAVDGALSAGGGMEYPNITVIGKTDDTLMLDRVIAHEVGHNWFYGMLGSNEREHAWMDEGINSFNENRYMDTKYPPEKTGIVSTLQMQGINIGKLLGVEDLSEKYLFDLGYRFNAVQKLDQPVDITSSEYTTTNYGTIVYGRTAILFDYLRAYLGDTVFDKCAQKYFEDWKFKHPYPEDVKQVYEEVSGKKLSWFFDDMIPTTKQIDYKICSAKLGDRMIGSEPRLEISPNFFTSIKVKNKGKISSPFSISAVKDGKVIFTQWYDGFVGNKNLSFTSTTDCDYLKIDAQNVMPDINRQNNILKMRGLCKKTEPFQLKMFGVLHNTDKTQLFWSPVIGWNNYNKFMLGVAVYNNLLLEKKLEWVVMPMYGFGNKDLAGGASAHYNIHPDKIFQTIRFGVNAEIYCYSNDPLQNLDFNKITPELTLEIKKKHLRSTLKQTIAIRQLNIMKDVAAYDSTYVSSFQYDTARVVINDFTYLLDNSRKINPYNVALNVQQGENFVRSSITANYQVTFKENKKVLDVRFFAGEFVDNKNLADGNLFFNASGATGSHDYMYDNVFLGRSERSGFLSHQFAETEGNMKVYTPLGRSNTWLASLNLKCPMPGKIRFKLFADISVIPKDAALKQTTLYDAGIYLPIIKGYVEVYFPLLMSKDIRDVFYANNTDLKNPTPNNPDPDMVKRLTRMIRFTFNIHKLNPFELVRNISL